MGVQKYTQVKVLNESLNANFMNLTKKHWGIFQKRSLYIPLT